MSFLPQGSTPQTSSFTCNTCGIKFVTADLQRQHMKTDWHRYNLKRRVAQLPSISSDVFAEKILEQSQQQRQEEEGAEDEFGFYVHRRSKNNAPRQPTKKFLRQQARLEALKRGRILGGGGQPINAQVPRSHSPAGSVASQFSEFSLGDSSHGATDFESVTTGSEINYSASDTDFSHLSDDSLDEMGRLGNDSEDDDSDDDDEEEMLEILPITHCFFCNKNNGKELENNIKHMFNHHGLYIPERTFLKDLEGLLAYLSEIVTYDHECLACGFEGKNLESVRQHMRSKGHCRIPYDTKEERAAIADFYDFSLADSPEDGNQPRPSAKTKKSVAFSGDNEDESEDEEGEDAVLVDLEEANDDVNQNYSVVHVDRSGVELTLPNGSRLGHRSMTRYYRQNLPGVRDADDGERTVALVDKRFAPGVTSLEVAKQQKHTQMLSQRAKNADIRRTKPARANYQKHYRDELLQ